MAWVEASSPGKARVPLHAHPRKACFEHASAGMPSGCLGKARLPPGAAGSGGGLGERGGGRAWT